MIMDEFVMLELRRNRGWPWPEQSFGKTPMYGEDGWCRSCGVPKRQQCGSLVLQRKGFARREGAWVPNWQFDAICMEASLAEKVSAKFDVSLLPVAWRGFAPGEAAQLVVPSVGERWFDDEELRQKTVEIHGTAGKECPECGIWRWMPLALETLPVLRIRPSLGAVDIAASPEWFGDGLKAFREILVRRELADLIMAASPGDFVTRTVESES